MAVTVVTSSAERICDSCHSACSTRLLASYKAALSAYDAVLSPCFQRLAAEHITYAEACRAKEDAFNALRRARRAYWQHV